MKSQVPNRRLAVVRGDPMNTNAPIMRTKRGESTFEHAVRRRRQRFNVGISNPRATES